MIILSRPVVYNADDLADRLNKYIDDNSDPILPEFCSIRDNPSKDTLYRLAKENSSLSDALKRLVIKQEAYLLRCENKPIMAIFRLKQPQHGYKDKQEIDTTVTSKVITVEMIGSPDD